MQTSYKAGDKVRVHETPGNRVRAENGEDISGRPAVIVRAMPYNEGQYEVTFSDVDAKDMSAVATAYVTADLLVPASS
jgi:hypothetical protein